jgi:hypothetical protein
VNAVHEDFCPKVSIWCFEEILVTFWFQEGAAGSEWIEFCGKIGGMTLHAVMMGMLKP